MEHFIIIRFSVLFNNRNEFIKKSHILFSDDRLKHRLKLFKNFCFPTIKNQTLKDFKVIILYDEKLPELYYNELYDIVKDEDYIILHKWNINDNLKKNIWLKPYIKNYDEDKYIITTRLDDDDMIHSNINKLLKRYINKFYCKDQIISFRGGNYLNINDKEMKLIKTKHSHLAVYLTKIHKIKDINIYGQSHDKIQTCRIIKMNNAFVVVNHTFGNDNRLERFSNKKGQLITLEKIFSLLE